MTGLMAPEICLLHWSLIQTVPIAAATPPCTVLRNRPSLMSFAVSRICNFGGAANYITFDNITLGAATPGGVPEPSTWAMMLLGFGAVGIAMRRRRTGKTLQLA